MKNAMSNRTTILEEAIERIRFLADGWVNYKKYTESATENEHLVYAGKEVLKVLSMIDEPEHVDWCRDLLCGGCIEIEDGGLA